MQRSPHRPVTSTCVLTFLVLFFAILAQAQSSAQCYYPNGAKAIEYNYKPCSGSTQQSSCCVLSDDTCLPSGLCFYRSQSYVYRAACTDKTWQDPSCARSCANDARSSTTWETLVFCNSTNTFCCQRSVPEGDCCRQAATQFDLGFDLPVDVLSSLRTHAANTSMGVNATSPEQQKSDDGSSSTATIAVGVVLGVLLAAALAFNVWQAQSRRRYKRLAFSRSETLGSDASRSFFSRGSSHTDPHAPRSVLSSGPRSVFSGGPKSVSSGADDRDANIFHDPMPYQSQPPMSEAGGTVRAELGG